MDTDIARRLLAGGGFNVRIGREMTIRIILEKVTLELPVPLGDLESGSHELDEGSVLRILGNFRYPDVEELQDCFATPISAAVTLTFTNHVADILAARSLLRDSAPTKT